MGLPAATLTADPTLHQRIETALSLPPTDWMRLRQIRQYSAVRVRGDVRYFPKPAAVGDDHLIGFAILERQRFEQVGERLRTADCRYDRADTAAHDANFRSRPASASAPSKPKRR